MTILIADDDRVLTQVLSTRLKKAGYKVVVVYGAPGGFETRANLGQPVRGNCRGRNSGQPMKAATL